MLVRVAAIGVAVVATSFGVGVVTADGRPVASPVRAGGPVGARGIETRALSAVVQRYCYQNCHNPRALKGNMSLEGYDVDSAPARLALSEKMIRKLRAQIMPPPGARRPSGDTLLALVETLEQVIDKSARPNPGGRTFQRLNRPEYERAVHDLLGVQINAGDYLPLDTKSANFDNIADVQALSPTLLEAYLNAAAAVSRIAIGDKSAPSLSATYAASQFTSQHPWDRNEGAPYGTRGGIVAMHAFPADGMYAFRIEVRGGVGTKLEDLDVSIDGARIALLHYEKGVERSLSSADAPQGADYIRTDPIFVKAGQQRVSVAFVRRGEGPYEDLIRPHDWSLAANGTNSAGTTAPPHIMELTIFGPNKVTGVSETPSRRMVFSCRPSKALSAPACADRIVTRIATRAYRRPLTKHDRDGLMSFYASGAKAGGFEEGVRSALQAILASPYFVFRVESAPANVAVGTDYALSDLDLASRLSFFLWGTIPDEQLLTLASHRRLSDAKVLDAQVKRMLADPRAEALATRFAAQWLRLQDVEKVHPDAFWFPDFDQQLADAMHRETELFFLDIVRSNKSVLDLFTADYTFVNERLARHYGIANVSGPEFRRVTYPDGTRRGLLGHGSILVQTSLANRTSPVLRGKWVMEVLIGMPPPPPPPNVPDLEQTVAAKDGRQLTTRERMEIHRANPTCNTCHQYMDPIGLALDNFDVTGKWRYRENGVPLDTRSKMYDGTPITTPADLRKSLLSRPLPLMRSFTENLMAYAVGRRVEDYDQPTIRAIVRDAESENYRMSSFILGVVRSPAFRSKRAEALVTETNERQSK
jgi:Protein of unknown function (DUF1592)/Protein of unknown function (DUF1588)/Protein of unknown function (DUF1595)/Protein of unknown function (DUF1585)/Protein of unknown function (DUF1587)